MGGTVREWPACRFRVPRSGPGGAGRETIHGTDPHQQSPVGDHVPPRPVHRLRAKAGLLEERANTEDDEEAEPEPEERSKVFDVEALFRDL